MSELSFPYTNPNWLSTTALSVLALPGVGVSRGGIIHQARKEGWRSRMVSGPGGKRYEFHVRSLPPIALEAYAERLLGVDVVAPLKVVKEGFNAGLKAFKEK